MVYVHRKKIRETINSVPTYNETTSVGKLCGTDRIFSHRALSLVQVQDAGHLGGFTLLLSAKRTTLATNRNTVHPFTALFAYPILSVFSGHNQLVKYP